MRSRFLRSNSRSESRSVLLQWRGSPGLRLVEPHMIAYTTADKLVLSSQGICPKAAMYFPRHGESHYQRVFSIPAAM